MANPLKDVRTDAPWQPQPQTAAFVASLLDECIQCNPHILTLSDRMRAETGTRLSDWIDSIGLAVAAGPHEASLRTRLRALGYAADAQRDRVWRHHAGIFPPIELVAADSDLEPDELSPSFLAIKVDSVDDFSKAMFPCPGAEPETTGNAGGQFRMCQFATSTPLAPRLVAVERHGWQAGSGAAENRAQQIAAAAKHRQAFAERRRSGDTDAALFRQANALFDAAEADLGRAWACDLFFAAERRYWMNRNAAGRLQYARQQRLGLGWANHDHHTYRSSRECFALLIDALLRMGFQCRERFYAGREAGWGAQVLEQPHCGIVIFADVDLTPDEVAGDFAHQPLPALETLGTVGLWCKLHGEAFLQAGMHHLECQFNFDHVRPQLALVGVETMAPFTDWPHLKQAFTRGEIWPVPAERIDAALAGGFITAEQAEQFRRDGAIGSHLEILERNDGFKGFNQTGISEIITRTDPRRS